MNVGTCGQAPCVTRSLTDNFTCTEWWPHYCCDSNADDLVDIQCDGFKYKATRVSSCSCRKCFLKTIVSGNAFGRGENGTLIPLKLGTILVYGKQTAMTNLLGFFSFEVPVYLEKIVVRLMDTIFKTLIDTTKTIELKPGTSTSINIVLPFRPQPIDFHSDSDFAMQAGTARGSKSPGGILIPKNSLVTIDGEPYKGKAKAQVHYMDPRNLEDFEASGGEFSYQEDGENCPLETYGVFRTHFEDDSGNPLELSKPIQFELDPTVINVSYSDSGEPNVELWKFDDNIGTWNSVGKMEAKVSSTRRRLLEQVFVGSDITGQNVPPIVLEDPVVYATRTVLDYTKEVQQTITYKNYYRNWWGVRKYNWDTRVVTSRVAVYKTQTYVVRDAVKHRGACFVNVAVYSDLSGKDIAKDMVSVTAVTRDFRKNIYKGFETQPVLNGRKCLKIFCDSEVYLYAEKEGARLIAFPKHDLPLGYNATNIKNSTEVVLYSRNYEGFDGRLGPVYFYEDEKACIASSNGFEFRFGMRYGKDPKLNVHVSENIYNNRLSWNPMPPDSQARRVCFIKVLLKIKNNFDIRFLGISNQSSAQGGQYGMYDVGPQPDKTYANIDERASCIEFRCPGMVNDAGNIMKNVSTLLEVRLNPIPKARCRFRQLKKDINVTVLPSGAGFQFYAEAEKDYGPKYGVYVKNENKANTQNYCFQGKDTGSVGNGMLPLVNAAVEFDCI
ncbi:cartilage intermediate layer protein 1-like [Mercenaria mercenaria]|uniref:cartilage intermediate layer protein 1-like n=1 Tax=Mercenaria mercenaria TaxID=6596 RepID=UPI00234EED77|nr:cartilage intermediate layer protein 1-like [Mercenaria mercenaria]